MIYFIQASDNVGPIKIGYAESPPRRLAELQRMSPAPLTILKIIEGDRKFEGKLHSHFRHFRQHGEWFKPEGELLAFIANPTQDLPPKSTPKSRLIFKATTVDYLDDIISAESAAQILGVSYRTIIRLAASGEIVGRLLSKQWVLSRESVLEYRQAQQGQKESE